MTIPKARPTISIPENTYQPSKAQLEADLRVNAAFDDAMDAVLRPVKIERVKNRSDGVFAWTLCYIIPFLLSIWPCSGRGSSSPRNTGSWAGIDNCHFCYFWKLVLGQHIFGLTQQVLNKSVSES